MAERVVWQPLNPVRWIERDGVRVLQQAWSRNVLFSSGKKQGYRQTGTHEWRDVPLMADDLGDPEYWTHAEPPRMPKSGAYAEEATCLHGVHPYDCRSGCDPHTHREEKP